MGLIIDSSVLISAERGTLDIGRLLRERGDEPIALAAITASELLHGCHRARNAATRARRSAFVEGLLDFIPTIPFGLAEARRHAELWADLARKGIVLSPHDLMIGSTAIAHAYEVATLNDRDFRRMPGVQLLALSPFLA